MQEKMVDEVIEADDETVIEIIPETTIETATTVVPLEDSITAAKLQTLEEIGTKILSNQVLVIQSLADIQGKLQLEFRSTDVTDDYQRLLQMYMKP